jgi:hypothetical protein
MFESNASDALKACCEIEQLSWTDVETFETFIIVKINTRVDNEKLGRTFEQIAGQIVKIFDKYEIPYKAKQLKF